MARSSPLISVFGGPVVDERIYHLRDMGPTGWFAGPVGELFGIPSFWIARLAKLLQFVSGSVILIDLIGQERIEAYSARVRQSLTALAARHSVGRIAGDLGATTRAYWRVLVGKAEDDAALRKALFATRFGEWGYLVGVLGAIPVAAWLAVRWHLAWYHAAWLLFLVVAVGASIAIGTYLLVMPVLTSYYSQRAFLSCWRRDGHEAAEQGDEADEAWSTSELRSLALCWTDHERENAGLTG